MPQEFTASFPLGHYDVKVESKEGHCAVSLRSPAGLLFKKSAETYPLARAGLVRAIRELADELDGKLAELGKGMGLE